MWSYLLWSSGIVGFSEICDAKELVDATLRLCCIHLQDPPPIPHTSATTVETC